MTLEELEKIEQAAFVDCDESDHEPPLVKRYLEARAAREQAEEAQANIAPTT